MKFSTSVASRKRTKPFRLGIVVGTVLALGLGSIRNADAQSRYSVLHEFTGSTDGAHPLGLNLDRFGNVYGTTAGGEILGTVFQLTPRPDGGWTENVLHRFTGIDGAIPQSRPTFDSAGNIYGTTVAGGDLTCHHPLGSEGCGVVFRLMPTVDGSWVENVLHQFTISDGALPYAGLILDSSGALFGTTFVGGSHDSGVIFHLTPAAYGGWTQSVLHSFDIGTGARPLGNLAFDKAGNLYGTTYSGGVFNSACRDGCGTVFMLRRMLDGSWTESPLYSFKGALDGAHPQAGIVVDSVGNLYGTASNGGDPNCNCGVVFKVSRNSDGSWREDVLHSFVGPDGAYPLANLIADKNHNLYGSASRGGILHVSAVRQMDVEWSSG